MRLRDFVDVVIAKLEQSAVQESKDGMKTKLPYDDFCEKVGQIKGLRRAQKEIGDLAKKVASDTDMEDLEDV